MALKVCSIASGSKGNCIYVSSGKTELVIDLGINYNRADKLIREKGGSGIKNILLTHCHSDHFSNVPAALERGATLYYQARCKSDLAGICGDAVEKAGMFEIDDIRVIPFNLSHDSACVGYKLICGGSKISIVTDSGYLSGENMDIIRDSGLVVLESNYDKTMLANNKRYPVWLKQRITGTEGHLSNESAAEAVWQLAASGVKKIMLAHLSEHNNTPALAFRASQEQLSRRNLNVKLTVATQRSASEILEVD